MSENDPPVVIAELGINHNGSLEIAKEMAKSAISNGAKLIKNQTHILEDEMSHEARLVKPGNATASIYEVISARVMTAEDEYELKNYVERLGAFYFTTPFSRLGVERVRQLDTPVVKIGSGEANNYPLVKLIASLKKPVIMSTGMNSIKSITPSVEIIRAARVPFALLHCTNLYPTADKLIRLEGIRELKLAFPDAVVGLSDHSLTNFPCLGAVALGASILERHFTDDKNRPGPDIVCSMDGKDLKELIFGSQVIFQARGGSKGVLEEEKVTSNFAFSSVVATKDIEIGEYLTEENIWVMRPDGGAYGPSDYEELLGKQAKVSAKKGFQLPKQII